MLRGYSRYGLGGLSLLLAAALLAAGPATAAGFSIFEAGSRATAMGGAFVAQADDLSAMFYNPAGLAKYTEKGELKVMAGVTLIIPTSELAEGYNPYPGQGYSSKMHDQFFFPPNLYVSYGLSECVSLSFGTWFPFGLATRWSDPDTGAAATSRSYVDLKQYAARPPGRLADQRLPLDRRRPRVPLHRREAPAEDPALQPLHEPGRRRGARRHPRGHGDRRHVRRRHQDQRRPRSSRSAPPTTARSTRSSTARRCSTSSGPATPTSTPPSPRRSRSSKPVPVEDDDPVPGADPVRHRLRLRQG